MATLYNPNKKRGLFYMPMSGGTGRSTTPPGPAPLAQIDNLNSMEFDGINDFVDTGQIDITGTKSVSFWIYPTLSGNDGGIFTMAPTGGTSDLLSIGLWQSNIQALTSAGVKQRSLQTISINTWYHIVVVKSTNTITNIYINGVNETLNATGLWNGTPANPQSKIGVSRFGSNYNFTGSIDEAAIFNTALTAQEVQSIYNATAVVDGVNKTADLSQLTTPPVAWYRM